MTDKDGTIFHFIVQGSAISDVTKIPAEVWGVMRIPAGVCGVTRIPAEVCGVMRIPAEVLGVKECKQRMLLVA